MKEKGQEEGRKEDQLCLVTTTLPKSTRPAKCALNNASAIAPSSCAIVQYLALPFVHLPNLSSNASTSVAPETQVSVVITSHILTPGFDAPIANSGLEA